MTAPKFVWWGNDPNGLTLQDVAGMVATVAWLSLTAVLVTLTASRCPIDPSWLEFYNVATFVFGIVLTAGAIQTIGNVGGKLINWFKGNGGQSNGTI